MKFEPKLHLSDVPRMVVCERHGLYHAYDGVCVDCLVEKAKQETQDAINANKAAGKCHSLVDRLNSRNRGRG